MPPFELKIAEMELSIPEERKSMFVTRYKYSDSPGIHMYPREAQLF
jgi:hypothetical protein